MKPLSKLNKILLSCALCLGVLISGQVTANEGKEASAAGSVPMARLEAFTVNLSGVDRYLQVNIALQLANPEVAEKIKAYMPVVRHKMIVMLSSKESDELNSLEGKRNLMT
ncbi:MAG: flagellar basal body-associated FliL family protein, partial [Burkholderiales bacterium]|nr:flagellar basal body-associated FliL family protein [Burkholderiales bacterium]